MTELRTNMDKMEKEAIRLFESGKLRRAERVLKQMLASNPNCLPAHFQLARVYIRTGEYKCALSHARRTLKLNPKEPNACLNLGLIYDIMGRKKLATSYYKKELSLYADSPETLFYIGRIYFRKHLWLNASKYLLRCFDVGYSFNVEDTVYKLGDCYYKLRDLQAYIDILKRYLKMAPNASWAAANLGCALLREKDYKGAVRWLSKANKLGVRNSVAVELAQAKKMLTRGENQILRK
jgi:tetratricopeptide (TPR) repeat protein